MAAQERLGVLLVGSSGGGAATLGWVRLGRYSFARGHGMRHPKSPNPRSVHVLDSRGFISLMTHLFVLT
jgi:hypothetical protein